MNIQTISKEKREVMVELTADDLVIICNALYAQLGEKKYNDIFMQLYSDMMMARDLCQYGHVDNFCVAYQKEQEERNGELFRVKNITFLRFIEYLIQKIVHYLNILNRRII